MASDLVYATCSLLYADGGADLWFISHDTMLACDGKLFKMLCKMGRDADVRHHISSMTPQVICRGLTSACRHGRIHVIRTILDHVSSLPNPDSNAMLTTAYNLKHRGKSCMPHLALRRAIQFGHTDLVHLLCQHRASILSDHALDTGLVCAVQFKHRDILQLLLAQYGTRPIGNSIVYNMWRMVVTVGATELVDLLPMTQVQEMFERAAQDDNWALILLLHKECKENLQISDIMLQALSRSDGTVRHLDWLLSQKLPEMTACLRRVIRRAIKLHDWVNLEILLKDTRMTIFSDDMQWLCESLLHRREADQNMSLFSMSLHRVKNPLCLVSHATISSSGQPLQPENEKSLATIMSCVRRSHIFMNLESTRCAIQALAQCPGTVCEICLISLLDKIGDDHDILQPFVTQLWSALAKNGTWKALNSALTWLASSNLESSGSGRRLERDQYVKAALEAATTANKTELVQLMTNLTK